MFVSGSVKGMFDLMIGEAATHAIDIAHVGNTADQLGVTATPAQFLLKIEHARLVLIDADQLIGLVFQNLPAEFGSDGTGCPSHHHAFVAQVTADGLKVNLNRVATKEIFKTDFAKFADLGFATNNITERGHGFERKLRFLADLRDALHLSAGRGGDGNQDFVDRNVS